MRFADKGSEFESSNTIKGDFPPVVGQSEGGMTAWRVNQRLALSGQDALNKARDFLGSVAIAPVNRPTDLIDYLNSMPVSTAIGRLTLIPQSCTYGGFYAAGNMANEEFYRNSSWTKHPAVAARRRTYMGEGYWKLVAPLMIIQGVEEGVVPLKFTVEDYKKTCKEELAFSQVFDIADQNHGSATNSAQADYMSWVNDLFNGKEDEERLFPGGYLSFDR
ncbi:Secretory lipase [Fusarium pseudoanthophilum]|uniref:Secretory lipase n=1 Tax=Fusarium pseudoanthophilum TaxID=48495 RepID=A0A8H5UVW7_9HYPO|nr:Secretory lipase [Fusarium pseudoanthophilum]